MGLIRIRAENLRKDYARMSCALRLIDFFNGWMDEPMPRFTFDALKRDDLRMNRHRALAHCSRMIFSENRFTFFRIMR
jgi:hypothetical protein